MKIALTMTGGPALAAALRAMPEAASKKIVNGALRSAGDELAARMAGYMPRSPEAPHVADHVVVQTVTTIGDVDGSKRPLLPDEYAVAVGPAKDFFYWFFREFGTVHKAASPAMRPAFDQTAARCLAIVVEVLGASIAATAAAGGRGGGA